MKRDLRYDLLRITAMFFMVGVHTKPALYAEGTIFEKIVLSVLFACNGLFFMLSGRFALDAKTDGPKEILSFYWKRFASIIPPFIAANFLISGTDMYINKIQFDLVLWIKMSVRGVIGDNNGGYLWFMYTLIVYIILAPFLGKMLQRLTDSEFSLLMILGVIWGALSIYLSETKYTFGYSGFIFWGWIFYFMLGYYEYRVIEKSRKAQIVAILAGVFCFVIEVLLAQYCSAYTKNLYDLAPLYVVWVFGLYVFIKNIAILKASKFIQLVVSSLASVSYLVYLIHRMPHKLVHGINANRIVANLYHFVVVLAISLAIAYATKWIFNWIKRMLMAINPFK